MSKWSFCTWTMNIQMFKLDFEKAEELEIKLSTSTGSEKKQETSRNTSPSALLNTSKPLIVWITQNSEKFLKRWEYQTTSSASWEIYMQVNKQQLELDMEKTDWFQIRKGVCQGYIWSPCLTSLQSTSCGMLGWMKHKLELRLPGEISITSNDTTVMAEREGELQSLLMKVKEESEKIG